MPETGWLVERVLRTDDPSGAWPMWLCIVAGQFNWTPDSRLAIRFARRQDAMHMMEHSYVHAITRNRTVATEHLWG